MLRYEIRKLRTYSSVLKRAHTCRLGINSEQKEGLIKSLVLSPNSTNNFAEQELRPITLSRKISYGSNTFGGMETTAILASVIQTYSRTEPNTFFPSLTTSIRQGFGKS